MKKLTILLLCIFAQICNLKAQDVIVFRNGKQENVKVIEVTQTEIKYKKFNNIDGPLYTVSQNIIESVKYKSGEVEQYGNIESEPDNTQQSLSSTSQQNNPLMLEAVPDEKNAIIIAKHLKLIKIDSIRKYKDRVSKRLSMKYAFTKNSVISTSEVEAYFERVDWFNRYNLALLNKTNVPLYVDLKRTFRVNSNGETRYYYDGKNVTKSSSSSLDRGVALGAITNALGVSGTLGTIANGITFGGGKSDQVTTSYSDRSVVIIAPSGGNYVSKYDSDDDSKGEDLAVIYRDVKMGEMVHYNEDDKGSFKWNYYITYSTDPSFSTYKVLKFTLYVHQMYGEYERRYYVFKNFIIGAHYR